MLQPHLKSKRIASAVAAVVLVATGWWCWDHRGYWLCDNFRVVEPGRIFAGGYQYPVPLKRIIARHEIKTVLSLREGDDEYDAQERDLLAAKGVQFRNVVIPYKVPDAERIARIQEAIAVITDEANQPVFVHCWAGCHRTGAVVAIYRVSRCGWTEAAARRELIDWGGTALGTQWPTRILAAFCSQSDSLARQPEGGAIR